MRQGLDIERERRKRPGETDLQWRLRVSQLDTDLRDGEAPLVTPEAERHGHYENDFVLHQESQTLARTKRNISTSPFARMHQRGQITASQYQAALEIAMTVERIQRGMSIRGASLEARVDNSGSASDMLIERLALVRMEVVYTAWRKKLPNPKQMFIDMIVLPGSLFGRCRSYRRSWEWGRERLLDALDEWTKDMADIVRNVDEESLERTYARLGEGKIA